MQQRKSNPDSFEKDAVRRVMARGSKTVAEVAKELGVSQSMLHRWRERFTSERSSSAQASQSEREEVERLRRELRDLQAENSPLKKLQPSSRGRKVTVYELIHAERANITVTRACGFFAHRAAATTSGCTQSRARAPLSMRCSPPRSRTSFA